VAAPADVDPRRFVAAAQWRFAKTMAGIPHEYVVENKVADRDGFAAFVAHMLPAAPAPLLRHGRQSAEAAPAPMMSPAAKTATLVTFTNRRSPPPYDA
jgi:hypothetical protein